jgi:hypothetical protein
VLPRAQGLGSVRVVHRGRGGDKDDVEGWIVEERFDGVGSTKATRLSKFTTSGGGVEDGGRTDKLCGPEPRRMLGSDPSETDDSG